MDPKQTLLKYSKLDELQHRKLICGYIRRLLAKSLDITDFFAIIYLYYRAQYFEWKLSTTDMKWISRGCLTGAAFVSPIYSYKNVQFCLTMHPNGYKTCGFTEISLFLYSLPIYLFSITVSFEFGIKELNLYKNDECELTHDRNHNLFDDETCGKRYKEYCLFDKLKQLNSITLVFKFRIIKCVDRNEYSQKYILNAQRFIGWTFNNDFKSKCKVLNRYMWEQSKIVPFNNEKLWDYSILCQQPVNFPMFMAYLYTNLNGKLQPHKIEIVFIIKLKGLSVGKAFIRIVDNAGRGWGGRIWEYKDIVNRLDDIDGIECFLNVIAYQSSSYHRICM